MKPIETLSDDEFVRLARNSVALPDAPLWLVNRVSNLWSSAPPASAKSIAQAALRLLTAVLSFDSWAQPQVVLGMRGAASATRHLLFSTKGRDIDLRINAVADHFALSGQILGPDEVGEIELAVQSGDEFRPTEMRFASLDFLGEFRLNDVRSGTYRLTFRMSGDEIVLPPISVGPPPS